MSTMVDRQNYYMHDIVKDAVASNRAVPALSVYDFGTAQSVVRTAEAEALPVILLVPPKAAEGVSGRRFIGALRALADDAAVSVSVQLDHAKDLSLIEAAVQAGADAVLADASQLPMRENASFVAHVRSIVGPGVSLEAELGNVVGDEDVITEVTATSFTEPGQVREFLAISGADLLAVSVGNVHGRYSGVPKLDWTRIEALRAIAGPIPLVLHGASGLPEHDIVASPAAGIGKVNFNTELRSALFDCASEGLPKHIQGGLDMVGFLHDWDEAACSFTRLVLGRLGGR